MFELSDQKRSTPYCDAVAELSRGLVCVLRSFTTILEDVFQPQGITISVIILLSPVHRFTLKYRHFGVDAVPHLSAVSTSICEIEGRAVLKIAGIILIFIRVLARIIIQLNKLSLASQADLFDTVVELLSVPQYCIQVFIAIFAAAHQASVLFVRDLP